MEYQNKVVIYIKCPIVAHCVVKWLQCRPFSSEIALMGEDILFRDRILHLLYTLSHIHAFNVWKVNVDGWFVSWECLIKWPEK